MSTKETALSRLKRIRTKLAHSAAKAVSEEDAEKKADCDNRKTYIDDLIGRLDWRTHIDSYYRRVFVSYSRKKGSKYIEYLEHLARTEFSLEVVSGFRHQERDLGIVPARIRKAMQRSTMFVGIMTKDHKLGKTWAPSPWVIEERGMALGMLHSLIILVENGVDALFAKTDMTNIFLPFSRTNYKNTFRAAVEQLVEKHEERLEQIQRTRLS